MCTIKLQTMMSGKTYPEAGQALFDFIQSKVDSEKRIVVDLDGVDSLPSMFLNVSIGRFIQEHGKDLLREKISFAQITKTQADRLKAYVDKF